MAKAKSSSASTSARIQQVEEKFARADAQKAETLVKESRRALREAKHYKRKADKRAAMASIEQDHAERHAFKNIEEVAVDSDAPDKKDFLNDARRGHSMA